MLVLWTKAKQIITYEENVVENAQEKKNNLRQILGQNCKFSSFSLNANVARFFCCKMRLFDGFNTF